MRETAIKRIIVLFGAVTLAAALSFPVSAGSLPPTTVVLNGDGTITASTDAVPNGGCIGAVSPTKYACGLYVDTFDGASLGFASDGGPTTVTIYLTCPCVAYFKVHAGQWKQYSADSAPFVP